MPIELLMMDAALLAAVQDQRTFETRYACACGTMYSTMLDVVRQTQAHHRAVTRDPPWGSYFAVTTDPRTVVGTCAFVGPPDPAGQVEIAYFTFPPFEGQGYGTAMARALIMIAQADHQVATIIAHTLPEGNASTRILTTLGMHRAGETVDPDAGPVWRWAYSVRDEHPPITG
jgi:[ribosomal protein S5]-alanine N-acetyltransferase